MRLHLAILVVLFANIASAEGGVRIRTLIDGADVIRIDGSRLWFQHRSYKKPGVVKDGVEPTIINGKEWLPHWQDAQSLPFTLPVALPTGVPVDLSIALKEGRGPVRIIEHPSPANGFQIAILIDDRESGADWYEFVLHWKRIK
jgi:hypothetical protein